VEGAAALYDENDVDAPDLDSDDDGEVVEHKVEKSTVSTRCFVGSGNNQKLVKDCLIQLGFQAMSPGMQFNNDYRIKWT
jgi:hypothetical protein